MNNFTQHLAYLAAVARHMKCDWFRQTNHFDVSVMCQQEIVELKFTQAVLRVMGSPSLRDVVLFRLAPLPGTGARFFSTSVRKNPQRVAEAIVSLLFHD